MTILTRRAALRAIVTTTAAGAVIVPATIAAAEIRDASDGATGMVRIGGDLIRFGDFLFDDLHGGKTSELAVVIMNGRFEVRELAYYTKAGPDAHTGLVPIGPEKWARVPVLGRVLAERVRS